MTTHFKGCHLLTGDNVFFEVLSLIKDQTLLYAMLSVEWYTVNNVVFTVSSVEKMRTHLISSHR